MKFFSKISLIVLCFSMLFTACQKENTDEIILTGNPNNNPSTVVVNNLVTAAEANSEQGIDLNCVTINYPFEMVLQSGDNLTITSKADFETATNASGDNALADFVFPLAVMDNNGNMIEMENNLALGQGYASCIPSTGWSASVTNNTTVPAFLLDSLCFELIYPVNLIDAGDTTYVANDEAELIDLFATVEDLFFDLPMTVINSDGEEVVIEDLNAFFNLLFFCEDVSPPVIGDDVVITGFGCNQLIYPINVELEDGTVVTVNDADEYANLLLSGTFIELVYPFSIENIDGEILVINSFEEFIPALVACGIGIEITEPVTCNTPAHILLFFNQGTGTVGCGYTIDFPLQLVAGGTTHNINNFTDYFAIYNAYPLNEIDMVYPATVTLTDGSTLTFEADEDICALIDEC